MVIDDEQKGSEKFGKGAEIAGTAKRGTGTHKVHKAWSAIGDERKDPKKISHRMFPCKRLTKEYYTRPGSPTRQVMKMQTLESATSTSIEGFPNNFTRTSGRTCNCNCNYYKSPLKLKQQPTECAGRDPLRPELHRKLASFNLRL